MIRQTRQLALASALALGLTGSALAQGVGRTAEYEALPAGTVLKVTLDQRLNSAEARPGQRFTATVRPEEDNSGLPEGTRVEGIVRAARPAAKDKPGVLDVDFTGLRFPNGRLYAVNGSLTSLDAKAVTRSTSGRLVSRRDSKSEKMKFIGYGAGAGAVIGLLTGNNLLKSAILGAAGGYLYGQLNKDKEQGRYANVNLKEGSEFGVRLDQRFAYVPVSYRRDDQVDRYGEPVGRRDRINNRDSGYRNGGGVDLRNRSYRNGTGADLRTRSGIGVVVDDREVNFGSARPLRVGSTVMMPLAPVMNAAGVRFQYDRLSREVNVAGDEGNVRTTLGSSVALVNGQRVRLAQPARIIEGTLYVPDRFVELATGMRAQWDDNSQTLLLESRAGFRDRTNDRYRDDRDDSDRGL